MKILHTSDWHLDHTLYNQRRGEEFSAFFNWLTEVICQQEVDVLIVSGDIFNNRSPSVSSQRKYFDFLSRIRRDRISGKSRCEHVIIVSGNHDSSAFLMASQEVLRTLNVRVVAAGDKAISKKIIGSSENDCLQKKKISEKPETLFFLMNCEQTEAVIVAAVPFLLPRDVMLSQNAQGEEEKSLTLNRGIQKYYEIMWEDAEILRQEHKDFPQEKIPVITTGHLFTQGGKTGLESQTGIINGFRDLYVGNMEHFPCQYFPEGYDYVALGHLHVPQTVGGNEHIRYSGSPLAISFGEAEQQKQVVLVDFDVKKKDSRFTFLPVPCFQLLAQVVGDMEKLESEINRLKNLEKVIWLEVIYVGTERVFDLQQKISGWVQNSLLEVLSIRNRMAEQNRTDIFEETEMLEHLDEESVFRRRLMMETFSEDEQAELWKMFREILSECKNE
ncbi:MAG: exonuclease SbcCD subunit D C-terminal domain-containing protein [Planctomycetia bacterium]|nr:exonuclease SbcCD subunit D C-terminal domain-containing protein [Planctomycetia bacterium]